MPLLKICARAMSKLLLFYTHALDYKRHNSTSQLNCLTRVRPVLDNYITNMVIEDDWIKKQRRRLSIKKRPRQSIFESPVSKENNKNVERPGEKWRRIARSIRTQNAWTRQCTVKLSTDSENEPMRRTKDRMPFNPNREYQYS